MNLQALRPPCRVLFLFFILGGGWLPCAHARVTVRDSQFGFSFELPVGFTEAAKDAAGQANADVLHRFVHPAMRGRPAMTIVVERLHTTLARPAGEPAADQTVDPWKTFHLSVEQSSGTESGEAMVMLRVRVPLAPEAVQITVGGPAAQEKRIRSALRAILTTLEGLTTWTAERTAAAAHPPAPGSAMPRPAPAKPVGADAVPALGTDKPLRASPPSAAAPNLQAPLAREPMSWWLIALCALGVGVLVLRVYWYYRRVKAETRYAIHMLLIALAAGMMIAVIAGANRFGPESVAVLAACGTVIGLAVWRMVWLSRSPQPPAAPPVVAASKFYNVDWTNRSDLQVRSIGLLIFAFCIVAIYTQLLEPLERARTERPSVIYLHEFVLVFVPLAVVSGLALAIFGKRYALFSQRLRAARKIHWPALIALIVLLAAGVALLCWFNAKMRALGYP